VKRWLSIGLFVFCSLISATADTLDRRIYIERSRGSVYELLNKVSERAELLFIYEKGVVDNDQRASIAAGTYTLREAILQITKEKDLQMKVIGYYILLYKDVSGASTSLPVTPTDSISLQITIEGYVKDRQTREAIPSCYVVLEGAGMGTVTNLEGKFVLKIPDSLSVSSVIISHIGYSAQKLSLDVFAGINPDIYLDQMVIQLQDVVVRYVPAQKIVREMLDNLAQNYAKEPAYFTSFYREGVEYRDNFASLTEGVFSIYKSGWGSMGEDQVKLLKMRNVHNPLYPDSILIKIQAGIRASLFLDIVQHLPDFLESDRDSRYNYTRVGMEYIDSGLVHVVAFEQKREIGEPLYKGALYINADNWALIKAEFEVNPRYIRLIGPDFIVKKSKQLDIDAQKITYAITYQRWEGRYWINHVRGDLQFKIKKKKSLFWSSNILNAYFEMATCEIDTFDVRRFPNRERLPTNRIFSQTQFGYDAHFWERFNTIVPEEQITKAISKLLLYVEEQ